MNPRFSSTVYREAAVQGASPVRLVVLLYEQAIQDLQRAVAALECGDVEQRTRQINHALLVIGQLQGTLDQQRGGKTAAHLCHFYTQVRSGLIAAQCGQSKTQLEKQVALLMQVRSAWCEVEKCEEEKCEEEKCEQEKAETTHVKGRPEAGESRSATESLSEWRA